MTSLTRLGTYIIMWILILFIELMSIARLTKINILPPMILATILCFSFLILVTESYCLGNAAGGNCLCGRRMQKIKCCHFLLSSRLDDNLSKDEKSKTEDASLKRIVLIRHGQTYMNELIGGGGIAFGQPNFTDIFPDPEDQMKYHDSPLSHVGIQQARSLNSKLQEKKHGASDALGLSKSPNDNSFLDDLDLVVVSPLTRALQTLELSLFGHIVQRNDDGHHLPVLAVAAAAERLYLVSDLGKPRTELKSKYPFVDFDSAFSIDCADKIESTGSLSGCSNEEERRDVWHFSPSKQVKHEYNEWRPHGEGQQYACLGEPSKYFDRRMSNFYYWLESRDEKCIAIVCHAGVIDWMTSGEQFSNCELRVLTFDSLRPRALRERIPYSR